MNKRQKIIVSIVGITIVLLALLGITYAYYLTRIQGNTNTNSISVTTAKLELVYGDNSAEIIKGTGALVPDSDNPIGTKTFTVTNNGNDSSYVVIIDNVSTKIAGTNTDTTFLSNDFRYTLTCTKSDGTNCNNVSDLTIFPIKGGILVSNDIKAEDVHTYTLTMWYIDTGIDQSDDMGKTYQARVNIADVAQMENPFKTGVTATDNASLAYNIIKNAKDNKNGTTFVNTPETKVAESISSYKSGKLTNITVEVASYNWTYAENEADASSGTEVTACTDDLIGMWLYDSEGYFDEAETTDLIQVTGCDGDKPMYASEEILHEKTLSVTQDDDGTSYYFRGNVEDNYVTFAGMCWRIVRIAGDGSIKIVLEDQDEACSTSMNGNWGIPTTTGGTTYTGNYGYELKNVDSDSSNEYIMSYLKPVTNADKSMARAFYDFQKDKLEDYKSKLKSGNWCLADKAYTRSGSSLNYTYTLLEEYNYSSYMYYDSYVRLYGNSTKEPTLKCTGTIMDKFESVTYNETEIIEEAPMYVSALTADEMVYAGGEVISTNGNFYLLNENFKSGNAGYSSFWSLSPGSFDRLRDRSRDSAFNLSYGGHMDYLSVSYIDGYAFRPAVSLASSAVISSGEGTLEKPYVIG